MKPSEYLQYDATALADLIRRGEVSAAEVLAAAIARAEDQNPGINAICQPLYQQARQQAPVADGLFSGVPLLLKDLGQEQAGLSCTWGSRAFSKVLATEDSEYVQRARAAGLIFMGRTATPEFGLKGITESELWGRWLRGRGCCRYRTHGGCQ